METEKLTACKDCSFYVPINKAKIWYDQRCCFGIKDEDKSFFNPVNGRYERYSHDHYDPQQYLRFCRDFNKNGHCEHFDSKGKTETKAITITIPKQKSSWWSRIFGKKTNNRKDVT